MEKVEIIWMILVFGKRDIERSFLLKGVFTANLREGEGDRWPRNWYLIVGGSRLRSGQQAGSLFGIWYFRWHIRKSPFSTLLMYSIWYNEKKYVIDFVVKDFPSWKCICSRPICVEAITAERGNKSVPNEKLPESGQLPPDLQDLPQVTNLFHCSAQELGEGEEGYLLTTCYQRQN